jgi:hypothetical protein
VSVNIYPAHTRGNEVIHADNWDDESTMNLANANFDSLMIELKLDHLVTVPGHIRLKILEEAISMNRSPRYNDRLKKLCAQAHALNSRHIAFS